MGVIFDTSFLIEAERRESEISRFLENRKEEVFGISIITVSELLHGVRRADSTKRRLKRSAYVEKVIELFPIYNFEISTARIYAELWADLSRKGIQIGAHDLIIGSTALSLGFSVVTLNLRHFERIEGLKIETLTLHQ
jgi:tRNA(fMet)-specific endonuclease VapC